MNFDAFRIPPGTKVRLKEYRTDDVGALDKPACEQRLNDAREKIAQWQSKLFAQNTHGLLVVLQGIDASGKDSTIKHVLGGVNPAGCMVRSFKVPSVEELDHDYLWRYQRALPERGTIGVFNRSYYEEVLVVRVHPELLFIEHLHPSKRDRREIWDRRFQDINHFESYLVENGFEVLKVFLHVSKKEQKQRFLERLDDPEKNWKFSEADVRERAFWDKYRQAFEDMLSNTSTEHAPWYVVPADRKWFTRTVVAELIASRLAQIDPAYPLLDDEQRAALARGRQLLLDESDGTPPGNV